MTGFRFVAAFLLCAAGFMPAHGEQKHSSLSLIVMDPLAAPLSCPCVEGYAQRNYEVLASHLENAMSRKVDVTFGESLAMALKKSGGNADIVIGKQSDAPRTRSLPATCRDRCKPLTSGTCRGCAPRSLLRAIRYTWPRVRSKATGMKYGK